MSQKRAKQQRRDQPILEYKIALLKDNTVSITGPLDFLIFRRVMNEAERIIIAHHDRQKQKASGKSGTIQLQ